MWKKTLLAGAAALALVGSTFVYAQQQPQGGADDQQPSGWHGWHGRMFGGGGGALSPQDRAAFLDARIAALKAGLQLTPDQEKSWPPFEAALRKLAKLRAEAIEARRAAAQGGEQGSHVDRLRKRADRLTAIGAGLKQLADAEEPLLASLDDAQKRRFEIFSRMARHHMGFMGRESMRERMERWHHGGGFGGGEGGGWHGHMGPGGMGPGGGSGMGPGQWRGEGGGSDGGSGGGAGGGADQEDQL